MITLGQPVLDAIRKLDGWTVSALGWAVGVDPTVSTVATGDYFGTCGDHLGEGAQDVTRVCVAPRFLTLAPVAQCRSSRPSAFTSPSGSLSPSVTGARISAPFAKPGVDKGARR